jgi:hypothetical protein
MIAIDRHARRTPMLRSLALILAQTDLPPGGDAPTLDPGVYWPWIWFGWGLGVGWWLYLAFFVWMLVDCLRRDPERFIWMWVILVFQPLGAVIYFFARWLPNSNVQLPSALRKWTRGKDIQRLRIAASQIGNAHQFVELGDALRETGQTSEAAQAYAKAIQKDGRNLQALWGAACVEYQQQQFPAAREKLSRVIEIDPAYKFGDVSLLFGKTLHALHETAAARGHLENHTRRWRHPEGLFLLAHLYADAGEHARAREQLQALIMDLDGAPRSIVRKHMCWKSRARKLLRKLPE